MQEKEEPIFKHLIAIRTPKCSRKKKKKNTLPISPFLLLNRAIDLFDRQDSASLILYPTQFLSLILYSDCRTNNL